MPVKLIYQKPIIRNFTRNQITHKASFYFSFMFSKDAF